MNDNKCNWCGKSISKPYKTCESETGQPCEAAVDYLMELQAQEQADEERRQWEEAEMRREWEWQEWHRIHGPDGLGPR